MEQTCVAGFHNTQYLFREESFIPLDINTLNSNAYLLRNAKRNVRFMGELIDIHYVINIYLRIASLLILPY